MTSSFIPPQRSIMPCSFSPTVHAGIVFQTQNCGEPGSPDDQSDRAADYRSAGSHDALSPRSASARSEDLVFLARHLGLSLLELHRILGDQALDELGGLVMQRLILLG